MTSANRSAGATMAVTSSSAATVADRARAVSAAPSPTMSPWPRTAMIFSPGSASASTLILIQPDSIRLAHAHDSVRP
ncbi:MAG TPA: hypothetical protein VGG16_25385 [Streptosporangiaceae bacterium]